MLFMSAGLSNLASLIPYSAFSKLAALVFISSICFFKTELYLGVPFAASTAALALDKPRKLKIL